MLRGRFAGAAGDLSAYERRDWAHVRGPGTDQRRDRSRYGRALNYCPGGHEGHNQAHLGRAAHDD